MVASLGLKFIFPCGQAMWAAILFKFYASWKRLASPQFRIKRDCDTFRVLGANFLAAFEIIRRLRSKKSISPTGSTAIQGRIEIHHRGENQEKSTKVLELYHVYRSKVEHRMEHRRRKPAYSWLALLVVLSGRRYADRAARGRVSCAQLHVRARIMRLSWGYRFWSYSKW